MVCNSIHGSSSNGIYLHGSFFENLHNFYLCYQLALLHTASFSFFLCQSPSSSLGTVFEPASSPIVKVLYINPSSNVFVFWNFNVHHKERLAYSGETNKFSELSHKFSLTTSGDPGITLTTFFRSLTCFLYVFFTVMLTVLHF